MMRHLPALALLWSFLAVSSCASEPAAPEPPPAPGATFAFAQDTDPRTLDPAMVTDAYTGFIVQNLFEGLLVWNAGGDKLMPGMAERYEVSPDGRSYTFHLRPDAIWSNGDPVSAEDFVLAWRRVLNPDVGSDYASLLFPIQGARAMRMGEVHDARELKVMARDRSTLLVELEHPTPWFLAILAHHVTAPVHARTVKRYGHSWTQPGRIVVNGPFLLDSWTAGEELVLRKNPYYHSADAVHLDRAVAVIEPDAQRVLSLYEQGRLQWTGQASGLPLERQDELAARADARSSSELGMAWYYLNTAQAPLDDVKVRQALSLSLDRAALAPLLGPGAATSASLVPRGIAGYTAASAPPPDPERARALLAEAGFPGGEGLPPLEIAVDDQPLHVRVARSVAAHWREVLGVEVSVFVREWGAHSDALSNGQFQIGRGGWLADYADPTSFLEIMESGNDLNASGWSDSGYDGLVREASQTEDAASRMRMLARAEGVLLERAAVLPLFQFGAVSLLKPTVEGWVDNPLGVHLLRYLKVRRQPSMSSPAGG